MKMTSISLRPRTTPGEGSTLLLPYVERSIFGLLPARRGPRHGRTVCLAFTPPGRCAAPSRYTYSSSMSSSLRWPSLVWPSSASAGGRATATTRSSAATAASARGSGAWRWWKNVREGAASSPTWRGAACARRGYVTLQELRQGGELRLVYNGPPPETVRVPGAVPLSFIIMMNAPMKATINSLHPLLMFAAEAPVLHRLSLPRPHVCRLLERHLSVHLRHRCASHDSWDEEDEADLDDDDDAAFYLVGMDRSSFERVMLWWLKYREMGRVTPPVGLQLVDGVELQKIIDSKVRHFFFFIIILFTCGHTHRHA